MSRYTEDEEIDIFFLDDSTAEVAGNVAAWSGHGFVEPKLPSLTATLTTTRKRHATQFFHSYVLRLLTSSHDGFSQEMVLRGAIVWTNITKDNFSFNAQRPRCNVVRRIYSDRSNTFPPERRLRSIQELIAAAL